MQNGWAFSFSTVSALQIGSERRATCASKWKVSSSGMLVDGRMKASLQMKDASQSLAHMHVTCWRFFFRELWCLKISFASFSEQSEWQDPTWNLSRSPTRRISCEAYEARHVVQFIMGIALDLFSYRSHLQGDANWVKMIWVVSANQKNKIKIRNALTESLIASDVNNQPSADWSIYLLFALNQPEKSIIYM